MTWVERVANPFYRANEIHFNEKKSSRVVDGAIGAIGVAASLFPFPFSSRLASFRDVRT